MQNQMSNLNSEEKASSSKMFFNTQKSIRKSMEKLTINPKEKEQQAVIHA